MLRTRDPGALVSECKLATTLLNPRARLDNGALLRSQAYVDGKWRGAASGAEIKVDDPFTGDIV